MPDALVMTALSVGDATAVAEHEEWLQASGRSHYTIHDRIRLLLRLNAWLLAQPVPKILGTATQDDLAKWQLSISKMATESIATYVGHAQGYYRWLAKYKHVEDVSTLLVRPGIPRRLPRPIADDDLRDALRMADGTILISLMMMAFCGLRVGEVAKLQRHDIRDNDLPPVVVVHGKGRKMRVVRMPDDLGPALRRAGVPFPGQVVATGQPVPARARHRGHSALLPALVRDERLPDRR
jgi:integrase/recombinase XerC